MVLKMTMPIMLWWAEFAPLQWSVFGSWSAGMIWARMSNALLSNALMEFSWLNHHYLAGDLLLLRWLGQTPADSRMTLSESV